MGNWCLSELITNKKKGMKIPKGNIYTAPKNGLIRIRAVLSRVLRGVSLLVNPKKFV
jgi:hypothetical protein